MNHVPVNDTCKPCIFCPRWKWYERRKILHVSVTTSTSVSPTCIVDTNIHIIVHAHLGLLRSLILERPLSRVDFDISKKILYVHKCIIEPAHVENALMAALSEGCAESRQSLAYKRLRWTHCSRVGHARLTTEIRTIFAWEYVYVTSCWPTNTRWW